MNDVFDPRNYFRMIERADYDSLKTMFADNAIFKFTAVMLNGRKEIIDGYRGFLGSIEGYRVDILHIWRTGENVIIVESVASGKNIDVPSGFKVPMVSIFELENGKIKEQRDYFDAGPMMPKAQQADAPGPLTRPR